MSDNNALRGSFESRVYWFLPERDYVTFGSLLSQIRLSVTLVYTQGVEASGNISSPFTVTYAGHPLTSVQNCTEIVLGEPLPSWR